jgi:hypothetical protein
MWLEVVRRTDRGYVGELRNAPAAIVDLRAGDHIAFGPEHVIGVDNPEWRPFEDKLAFAGTRLLTDDTLEPGFVRHDTEDEGKVSESTGDVASGWELYVGDETDEELATPGNVRAPNLAWLMERYPAFGDLVFSGAREGEWELRDGRYVPVGVATPQPRTRRRRLRVRFGRRRD